MCLISTHPPPPILFWQNSYWISSKIEHWWFPILDINEFLLYEYCHRPWKERFERSNSWATKFDKLRNQISWFQILSLLVQFSASLETAQKFSLPSFPEYVRKHTNTFPSRLVHVHIIAQIRKRVKTSLLG